MGTGSRRPNHFGWELNMAAAMLASAFEVLGFVHLLPFTGQLTRNLSLALSVWCDIGYSYDR